MKPIRAFGVGVVVFLVLIVLFGMCTRQALAREGLADLIPMLKDAHPLVQFEAAYALGSLGAEARPAVPALIELLHSDDHDDTEIATFVLARIAPDPGIEPAVPVLIETLQGGKGWVASFHAAVALLKLGREEEKARAIVRDEVHLALMLPLLRDSQPMSRLHVCEALMLYGPPHRDFLDLLRKTAAEESDVRVREAALKALRKVGAAERGAMPDTAPKALATLPPDLAEAGQAMIESQKALETGDIETFRKHLTPAARKEFDRDPRLSFAALQEDSMTGLRLLGGTLEGGSATIDFFRWSGTIYSHGTVTMVRKNGQWVRTGISDYRGYSEPYVDDSTPLGLRETAALALLKAVAAAQIHHWYKTSTYAGSLAQLDLPAQAPGYVITLTAGGKSNGVYHAWSAEAHPAGYPETGVHSYYTDERGVILQSDTRGLPLALEMPEH